MDKNNIIVQIKAFQNTILNWYDREGRFFPWRNKSASKYQMVVAEVLLQRTKAETVAGFYKKFIKEYPSWKALSKASETSLRSYLKPIGLWKQRASVLSRLSKEMASRNGRFPVSREEIELLPGVGQYIANAVEMFCYGKAKPLLDVNMARVLERFFGPRQLADIRYDPYLQDLAHKVVPGDRAKEFNWAILDFAALVCKARKPGCTQCPLKSKCCYYTKNIQDKEVL